MSPHGLAVRLRRERRKIHATRYRDEAGACVMEEILEALCCTAGEIETACETLFSDQCLTGALAERRLTVYKNLQSRGPICIDKDGKES
jgi:hypothetical protein